MSSFDVLVGKIVQEACYVHDYVQLRFDGDYGLTINNAFDLFGPAHIGQLVGKSLRSLVLKRDQLDVAFDGDMHLIVHLEDGAWASPEALVLHGPEHFIAVWGAP